MREGEFCCEECGKSVWPGGKQWFVTHDDGARFCGMKCHDAHDFKKYGVDRRVRHLPALSHAGPLCGAAPGGACVLGWPDKETESDCPSCRDAAARLWMMAYKRAEPLAPARRRTDAERREAWRHYASVLLPSLLARGRPLDPMWGAPGPPDGERRYTHDGVVGETWRLACKLALCEETVDEDVLRHAATPLGAPKAGPP